MHQVHGGQIVASSACAPPTRPDADGLLLETREQKASIYTADCVPLVLVSDKHALLLHVSRKSLVNQLLDMVPHHLTPSTITYVFIGPHICATHFAFEVMGPELEQFATSFPAAVTRQDTTWHLNLQHVVQAYLDTWKIPVERQVIDERCTYETRALPSYRRALDQQQLPLTDQIATVVTGR